LWLAFALFQLLASGPENTEEVKQKIAKFTKEESSLKRRELF
jgi:hypothetical protein